MQAEAWPGRPLFCQHQGMAERHAGTLVEETGIEAGHTSAELEALPPLTRQVTGREKGAIG